MKKTCLLLAAAALLAACASDTTEPADSQSIDNGDRAPAYFEPVGRSRAWASISGRCGILDDGSLWCWGHEPKQTDYTPVRIGSDADWAAISARDEACALKTDGSAWCFALPSPRLVDAEKLGAITPEKVEGASPWKSVATGSFHSCFLDESDHVFCRGALGYDLGHRVDDENVVFIGSQSTIVDYSYTPLELDDRAWNGFVAALSGSYPSLSCGLDGSAAYCWTGTPYSGTGFEPVAGDKTFEKLAAGAGTACGLDQAGAVWCWGESLEPAKVGEGFTSFDVDGVTGCGIKADASLWCWGTVPGNGTIYSKRGASGRGGGWKSVTVGKGIVCGVKDTGEVACLDLPDGYGIFDVHTRLDEPRQVDGPPYEPEPACDLLVCQVD